MTLTVPVNQSVSWTVYLQAVGNESRLPHSFIQEQMKRIERAFDHGEPIHMIVEELKMVFAIRPMWSPTKTPRQLAKRVMKLHDETMAMLKG
jgi:hypothetical protein